MDFDWLHAANQLQLQKLNKTFFETAQLKDIKMSVLIKSVVMFVLNKLSSLEAEDKSSLLNVEFINNFQTNWKGKPITAFSRKLNPFLSEAYFKPDTTMECYDTQ